MTASGATGTSNARISSQPRERRSERQSTAGVSLRWGNGRLGRLLITLMLCDAGLLREPLLYLSLYFRRNRSTSYQLLNDIRHTGDWEAWWRFFLEGVRNVAEAAVATARSAREGVRVRRCECISPSSNVQSGAFPTSRREPACPHRPWPPCYGFLRNST